MLLSEAAVADGMYMICDMEGDTFYCDNNGDATLKATQAHKFMSKDAAVDLVKKFLSDVIEYSYSIKDVAKLKAKLITSKVFSKKYLHEDFGMGVGAPLGADQGIPYGGDGKAVVPCYMGMTSRFGQVSKPEGFGKMLWPKKRKIRRRRNRVKLF